MAIILVTADRIQYLYRLQNKAQPESVVQERVVFRDTPKMARFVFTADRIQNLSCKVGKAQPESVVQERLVFRDTQKWLDLSLLPTATGYI